MISISKTFLLFAIILLPFNYLNVIYNFSISDLFFTITFILCIAFQINHRISIKYLINNNDFILPIVIYSIGFFLSVHFAFSPLDSLLSYLQIVFIFIVIYYALYLQSLSSSYIKNLLYTLSLISGLITLGIFIFFITGIDYSYGLLLVEQGWGMIRFSYGAMEPNITARIMAQSIPILIFISVDKSSYFIKIVNLVLITLLLAVIVLTASRSGFLILLIGLIFFLIFYYKYKQKYNLFYIILNLLCFSIVLFFIYNSFPSFFENSFSRYSTIFDATRSASSQERLLVLNKSFELIDHNPYLGYGLSNSQNITGIAVHNSIVISWLENGIFGLIGYSMLYFVIIFYIFKAYTNNFYGNGVIMVLSVISIMMISGDMFMANSYKRSLWVPAILFVAYSRQILNKKNNT